MIYSLPATILQPFRIFHCMQWLSDPYSYIVLWAYWRHSKKKNFSLTCSSSFEEIETIIQSEVLFLREDVHLRWLWKR